MTLLVTVFAAVISTALWYMSEKARKMKVGTLVCMYWGAALMWLVDSAVEYLASGAAFFTPVPADMINDLFLGFSAIALGLVIWLVTLLAKDPNGTVRSVIMKK